MHRLLFLCIAVLLGPAWSGGLPAQVKQPTPLVSVGSTEVPVPIVSGTFALWSGGALVVVQERFSGAPVFRVIDRQGKEISRTTFTVPGASEIDMFGNSIARGPDGSLAIIGQAYTNDSRGASFLAWISADGKEQRFVRLSPFLPEAVTVAADGCIWVAGHEKPSIPGKYDLDQHLIRRFDRTGKLLGSFVPWSSLELPPRALPLSATSILAASPDRVGWYSPIAQTYIEFSLDGSVTNRIKTPEHPPEKAEMLHVALCDDGSLFVSATLNTGPQRKSSWGIFVLDRERTEWSFIPRAERFGKLYGCDGTRLAATTDNRTITWLAPKGQ